MYYRSTPCPSATTPSLVGWHHTCYAGEAEELCYPQWSPHRKKNTDPWPITRPSPTMMYSDKYEKTEGKIRRVILCNPKTKGKKVNLVKVSKTPSPINTNGGCTMTNMKNFIQYSLLHMNVNV
jgi:hypothetical protein